MKTSHTKPKNTQSIPTPFSLEKIIPITRARREFFTLTDNVLRKSARYIITDHGSPKAALLPVSEVFHLFDGASLAADTPSSGNTGKSPRTCQPRTLFPSFSVADGWRDDTRGGANKDIVRSQLTVRLMEKNAFPGEKLIVGCSVSVSDNQFIEADILAHDGQGHVLAIFIVTELSRFDDNRNRAIDDLFALIGSLREQHTASLRLGGYYARGKNTNAPSQERFSLIDCRLYPTRLAWESAGAPTLKDIPTYIDLLSKH